MTMKKWRNPYAPMTKKPGQPLMVPASAREAFPPSRRLAPPDVRASVLRVRNNIKGISSTIRQMEETMDTLYGAMEIFQTVGRTIAKPSSPAPAAAQTKQPKQRTRKQAVAETQPEAEATESTSSQSSDFDNLLANIDVGQILNLLQSPLVQNLIQQNLGSGTKRKKEG